MTGLEEIRPIEGMWAPLKVRLELRHMFERWLSRSRPSHPIFEQDGMVDELSLLDLCQHYRLDYPGGMEGVAKTWDESEQRIADGGPTFDELKLAGWVFFDGGRWMVQSAPLGTLSHITYPSPSTKTFLTELGKARLVEKTDTPTIPDSHTLATKRLIENWLDRRIPTRDPEWLAGRLWERLCPKLQSRSGDSIDNAMQAGIPELNDDSRSSALLEAETATVDKAFLEWSAWCHVIGSHGSWDNSWGATEKRYCLEAAARALNLQTLWGAWDNDTGRYADVLLKTFAIPRDQLRYVSNPRTVPPRTLVSRVDWLRWPEVEHLIMERLGVSTVGFAFGLLCSQLERTDIGPSITEVADTVLSFAAHHPMALQHLLFRVDAVPGLLVDMLMHKRAACLAVRLVVEWRPELGRHSDRNLSRQAQTKTFAVQDALCLLAYHLDKGTSDPEELASLITWCYEEGTRSGKAVADSRQPVGRQLLGMIAREEAELQSVVLQHLIEQSAYVDNLHRARFSGVLEGLNLLSKAHGTDALPIVELYSKFARDRHLEWTDAHNLSAELAARLVASAFAQPASDRDGLLIPFDSAKLLREATDDEMLSLRSSIAQTLRGHVRLLARAVAGWPDGAVPKELSDALQILISRSVIEHAEKGRVGALTDRYSPRRFFGREEGSPALDLTAAWRRLDGSCQDAMLLALAQSDDPVLLAELCQHLPAAAKPGIQARMWQLKPGEASELWTWPELQHRIESLLLAGEYGLAREHLYEAELSIERAPQQFRLGLFGLELRLSLQEKNWDAIDSAVIPSTLDELTARQAQDQLDFYRATSQLFRESGNLANALAVLQRLSARPGAAPAYRENFFAIAIQQLLGPTLDQLSGAKKATGEDLLAEINAALEADEQLLASSSLPTNRSLLLLALDRPKDALESVAACRSKTRSPDTELIAVLAKSGMGFRDEAMAILDAAITEFGADERLMAAKKDLQAGVSKTYVASASDAVDPMSFIRNALQQLAELPPSQLGDVLGPPGRGVRGYLVRQVSRAVAALQHMAAILRDRKNPEDEARFENDLNTAVREVLGASLAIAKWDVSDQSLGGATLNGNPGERDAVIRVSGQEISIYEALVCNNLDRSYTKQHFDKLLSYGICDIYFHVTYSYAREIKPLLDYVRHMLEHEIPSDHTYLGCEILEPPDYETSGYVATYSVDHREVAVVFLIADLKA
ncbi:hypothetical protein [Xanthomonas euvesicatoria]|uniref:hypothetical protein n=1 Tax=Xanthomonas euvesicatoria TaxID=456327 RepID=UPI000F8CA14D|nr:hypothetical protein [Xanthomonas euvesicatoria]